MTAPAVHNGSPPAPHSVPAVASGAIRALLTRPPRPAIVLGGSSDALWLDVTDDVIVVGGRNSVRLPNGIETGVPDLFGFVGAPAVVGSGHVRVGPHVIQITRWWVARPSLPDVRSRELAAAEEQLPIALAGVDHELLGQALGDLNGPLLIEAAPRLMGLGAGLTPVADDLLAAALATFRLVGGASGHAACGTLIDIAAPEIVEASKGQTTALSAAPIRHAMAGNVAVPVAALIRAVAGRGDVHRAMRSLEGVGHSSGPALVAGVGLGVRSVRRAIRSMREEAGR